MKAQEFLLKVKAAYDQFLNSIPSENVAVTANEEVNGDVINKESTMDEIKKEECGTPAPEAAAAENTELEATAAKDKEEPQDKPEVKEEDKKEDKKDEGKEKEEKKDEPAKEEPKMKEIPEADFKKLGDLVKEVLENEKSEAAAGEDESEDIKKLEEAAKLLGVKVEKEEKPEGIAPVMPEAPAAEAPVVEETLDVKEEPAADINPFASLVATFEKKATLGDSVWMIKNASDNSDYLSFNVKAAFGAGIDNDDARAEYAQSQEFGKAVVAALINEKVASAVGAKAAVLGVVAHYNPGYAGLNKYPDYKAANPGAAGAKVEVETDKNIVSAKEAKASENAAITKTAAEEGPKAEALATDATILPDAVKVAEDENTKPEKSAVAYQGPKIPAEGDRKVIASMEETIKKQADEINALKLQAAITEKTAKVKEAVNLMVRAGLIKSNEQVRIAALKDGLSIEAAAAKGMAAAIETQSKNLFGMNSLQLDSYIKSLAELSPRVKTVQASVEQPLNVKSSTVETEEQRLAKLFGWD